MVFKVSQLQFADGSIATLNLHSSQLLADHCPTLSLRDLLLTLNVTSKMERKQQKHPGERYTSSLRHRRVRRSTPCAIVPRKDWIVVSFGNTTRAVLGVHSVYLFDAHTPAVQALTRELAHHVMAATATNGTTATTETDTTTASSSDPMELVVLEHILRDTVEQYQRRLRLLEPIVYSFLDKIDNHDVSQAPDDDSTSIHQLAPLKDALQSFQLQVHQSEDCLAQLLQQDDTMLQLLLTEHHMAAQHGVTVDASRHEEVEMILGVYAREIGHVHETIALLLQRIQSKQEFVALRYSGYRNRMIRLNVLVAIAGVSLGWSTAVAGFFGMNLVSGFESTPNLFATVVLVSTLSSAVVATGCLAFLRGSRLRQQAAVSMADTERLTRALQILSTLDQSMKVLLEESERGDSVSRERFRAMLMKEDTVSLEDADALFNIFDRIEDGSLTAKDFQSAWPRRS